MNLPEQCDLGILTVISIETEAMLRAFGIQSKDAENRRGVLYWRTSLDFDSTAPPFVVVIGFCAEAGTVSGALRTVRFVQDFSPALLVLAGISAGQKGKYLMGDVVYGNEIADLVMGQIEDGEMTIRPSITPYPKQVGQLIGAFKCAPKKLKLETVRILKELGKMHVRPRDEKKAKWFKKHVTSSPNIHDCVIGSGNLLVRDGNKFPEYQKIHPKITAIEMEAAGFVRALKDVKPEQPWLVIRGISDFGDSKKDKNFNAQPYASAAAAAYVRLLAGEGLIRLLFGDVPPLSPGPSSASQIPGVAAGGQTGVNLASEISVGVPKVSDADGLVREIEKLRHDFVKAPTLTIVDRLQALRGESSWLTSSNNAQILALRLEFEAVAVCGEPISRVERVMDALEKLNAGTRTLRARLSARRHGPAKAADELIAPTNLEEWNLRMGMLLQAGRSKELLEQFAAPPEGVGPDSESRRLHALALIMDSQLGAAAQEIAVARQNQPEAFGIRFASSVLDYFTALSPGAPREVFKLGPVPIPLGMVKADAASVKKLDDAAAEFASLADLIPGVSPLYLELRLWRLASLANNVNRQKEASDECQRLLEKDPSNAIALQWGQERQYVKNLATQISDLAAKLNVQI